MTIAYPHMRGDRLDPLQAALCQDLRVTESYPDKTTLTYEGFADIECTVDRISPLDGNSGETVVHIETNGHIYAYLHHKLFKDKESSDFSVRLIGESEHENLAALFRDVADILDPRSRTE